MEGSVLERGANEDVYEDRCGQGVGHDKDEDELEVSTSHGRSLASRSPGGKCIYGHRQPYQPRLSGAAPMFLDGEPAL